MNIQTVIFAGFFGNLKRVSVCPYLLYIYRNITAQTATIFLCRQRSKKMENNEIEKEGRNVAVPNMM